MKKIEKKICGEKCEIYTVGGRWIRLSTNMAYGETPNALLQKAEKISDSDYILSDNGQQFLLTCFLDGSCMINAEALVPVDISDEQAEEKLEENMNRLEKLVPELKGQISSSAWWLGKSAEHALDFLLNKGDTYTLRTSGDGLRTAVFTCKESAALKERSGETVEIIRALIRELAPEESLPMYWVKFRNGLFANVFGDELTLTSKDSASVNAIVKNEGLMNVLGVLMSHPDEITEAGSEVVKTLETMYLRNHHETSYIADLASFESNILWSGADDVRYVLESGCFDDDLKALDLMDEYNQEGEVFSPEFVKAVTNDVDWDDVASAGIEAGNELIEQSINDCLRTYRSKKEKEKNNE